MGIYLGKKAQDKIIDKTKSRLDKIVRASTGELSYVPVMGQLNEHIPLLFNTGVHEYYTEALPFVELNLMAFMYYDLDLPGLCYDMYNIEAEALGQKMTIAPNQAPDIDRSHPLITEPEDLDQISPPDFYKSGRMPYVLKILKICRDIGLSPRIRFCCPFTLAANIRGIEPFLFDIMERPDFAHKLLHFITEEVLIPWISIQKETYGNNSVSASGIDALASPPIVTIEILEEFVFPYAQRIKLPFAVSRQKSTSKCHFARYRIQ